MEKKLENISKLADDIVLTEQNERKLFIAYKKRIESQRRKKVLMRGYYRVAVVALAMMIMFSVNYYLQSPDLVVYAATGDKMVQLRLNERVNLEKQRTPLGYGYVLEMSVEEGSRYYTIENEQNLNADNIFRNGNKIFWMPDGMNSINFRDQDGNVIKIPETDSSTLNIEVCNYDGKMVERITLILERRDGQCSVEMLKTIKKIWSILLVCGLILVPTISVSAAEQEPEKVEVSFFNENGEEVSVSEEIADSFMEQLDVDKEVNIVSDKNLRASCTHIPCNQVKTTLYGHAKVSPTECWVYTKRVIMCKCCGAALKSLSDWQFAYSHAPH